MKKKHKLYSFRVLLIVLLFVSGCSKESTAVENTGLIDMIKAYRGYVRVVNEEEYNFYAYFVKRDQAEGISPEKLEEKVREYANEVNAIFYLGNKLNLYEPYSFELLKMRMEQENNSRKVKLENKEAIYGLEKFTLETYFQYEMGKLEMDIQTFIEEHIDEEMVRQAQRYYHSNKEAFQRREAVTYEMTIGEETQTLTTDREGLNFMGKSDKGLGDFLEQAVPGDIYEDEQNGENRRVLLKEIQYSEEGFENNRDAAIYTYIEKELYPLLIKTVAENNPVEFSFD